MRLPPSRQLFVFALAAHGYTTGGIVSNTNLTEAFGFAQGFDEYQYLGPDYLFGAQESSSKLVLYQILRRVYFMAVPGLRFGDFYQDSAVVNGHAFEFLERHRGSRFFLFLHYMDPHDPYFRHPYDGHGFARAANQHQTPALAEEMRALYRGEIAYLDANFGKLIARLQELGLYDDSVIALVADHGEEFLEHGGFWHGLTLYEEQIQVPLLVKWLPIDWDDYWVLDLAPDYSHVLVGEPTRGYFWILARSPSLDDSTYARLLDRAKALGYDPAQLVKSASPR